MLNWFMLFSLGAQSAINGTCISLILKRCLFKEACVSYGPSVAETEYAFFV